MKQMYIPLLMKFLLKQFHLRRLWWEKGLTSLKTTQAAFPCFCKKTDAAQLPMRTSQGKWENVQPKAYRGKFRSSGIQILVYNSYITYRLNDKYSTCACWLLGGNLSFRCFSISEAAAKYPWNTEQHWLMHQGGPCSPPFRHNPQGRDLPSKHPALSLPPEQAEKTTSLAPSVSNTHTCSHQMSLCASSPKAHLLGMQLCQVTQHHCEGLGVVLLNAHVHSLQAVHAQQGLGLLKCHGACAREISFSFQAANNHHF